jgi:hypothetical protein
VTRIKTDEEPVFIDLLWFLSRPPLNLFKGEFAKNDREYNQK